LQRVQRFAQQGTAASRWPSWRRVSAVCIKHMPMLSGQPVGRARSSRAASSPAPLVRIQAGAVADIGRDDDGAADLASGQRRFETQHQVADGAPVFAALEGTGAESR
jgi:hypothetical protein